MYYLIFKFCTYSMFFIQIHLGTSWIVIQDQLFVPTPWIEQSFSIFLLTSLPNILPRLYLLHASYRVSLSFFLLRCLAFSSFCTYSMHLTKFLYLSSRFVTWHSRLFVPTPCIIQSFSIFLLASLPSILPRRNELH